MLMPKKVKYRKQQRGRLRGIATQKNELDFGQYGLRSLENSWVTSRQIEAARRAITRYLKRGGKLWIRIFPDKAITKKGSEVPMGTGKGPVEYYVACVKKGMVMFEMDGVTESIASEAFRLAGHKLPVMTKLVIKK
jgi:large subunit ribosomal protein L16